MLALSVALNCAFVGITNGKESPSEVARCFVDALAIRGYAEVVKCVYEPWMYSELDSLCADRPGVSYQDREDCARSFGASSLSDFATAPKARFIDAWARREWPSSFPPESTRPPSIEPPARVGGWERRRPEVPFADRSQLIVRTVQEVIESPREAFVELNVRLQRSFCEVSLLFSLRNDVSGEWRISGVKRELLSE